MKKCFLLLLFFLFLLPGSIYSQERVYEIDASRVVRPGVQNIPMYGRNPAGTRLSVNSRYFEKDGRPWFPLMGEMHYNRVPSQDWENGILKMKVAGLSIVATYVFWNEHETAPGVWDWKGNRDLRKFVALCAKQGMYGCGSGPGAMGNNYTEATLHGSQRCPGKGAMIRHILRQLQHCSTRSVRR